MKLGVIILGFIVVVRATPFDVQQYAVNRTANPERNVFGFAGFSGGTQGGLGGATWTVWDAFALRNALNSNDRRVIYIRGRIDLTELFVRSPGVWVNVGRFTSLLGGDNNAEIHGGGLRLNNVHQIIIQNIKFNNALSYAPGEQPDGNGGIIELLHGRDFSEIDAIEITRSEYVWIDHCEFSDDPWIAANMQYGTRRHDGLLDIVRGSNYITVSYNIFRNHNPVTLVGNRDDTPHLDDGKLKVTFFANWYQGVDQRNPRVRFGEVHVLNNLYTDVGILGIGVGVSAKVYVERNVFVNTWRAWGFVTGPPNPMGYLVNEDNLLRNSNFDHGVPSYGIGWHPRQYYNYNPISVHEVENHVRRYAGAFR